MRSWPKDTDLSPDVAEALSRSRPESTDLLLSWLLERFRGLADPDYVDDCLLVVLQAYGEAYDVPKAGDGR